MSMITEQIKSLRRAADFRHTIGDYMTAGLHREAADTIETLSAKVRAANMERSTAYYNGGWIPAKERLPKDSEFVLLTIRRMNEAYNHQPFISVGYIGWNQTAWWCAHDGDCEQHQIDVLAWMPLPEPYREDGETDEKC